MPTPGLPWHCQACLTPTDQSRRAFVPEKPAGKYLSYLQSGWRFVRDGRLCPCRRTPRGTGHQPDAEDKQGHDHPRRNRLKHGSGCSTAGRNLVPANSFLPTVVHKTRRGGRAEYRRARRGVDRDGSPAVAGRNDRRQPVFDEPLQYPRRSPVTAGEITARRRSRSDRVGWVSLAKGGGQVPQVDCTGGLRR